MTHQSPKIVPVDARVADASRRRLLRLPTPSLDTDAIADHSQKRSF
jgi:hypothetical protein